MKDPTLTASRRVTRERLSQDAGSGVHRNLAYMEDPAGGVFYAQTGSLFRYAR